MAEEQGSCNGVLGAVPLRQPEAEPSSLEVSRPMSSAGSVSKLIEQAVNGDRAAWAAAGPASNSIAAPAVATPASSWPPLCRLEGGSGSGCM